MDFEMYNWGSVIVAFVPAVADKMWYLLERAHIWTQPALSFWLTFALAPRPWTHPPALVGLPCLWNEGNTSQTRLMARLVIRVKRLIKGVISSINVDKIQVIKAGLRIRAIMGSPSCAFRCTYDGGYVCWKVLAVYIWPIQWLKGVFFLKAYNGCLKICHVSNI